MDPGGQFAWFESILLKARRRRGTVSPYSFLEKNHRRHLKAQIDHFTICIHKNSSDEFKQTTYQTRKRNF
jgi:hypothetical protein